MNFFFFIFKHRFRKIALNNILNRKKIEKNIILNFSGPIKYLIFSRIIFFLAKIFNNICLISCDGKPLIKINGINIWFGGTSQKLDKLNISKTKSFFLFDNFIKREKNLINFYPTIIKKKEFKSNFKIVFVGNIFFIKKKISYRIWEKRRNEIFSNFRIIENRKFWKRYRFKNNLDLLENYINLKNIIRYEILQRIIKLYPEKILLIGSSWNRSKNSLPDNFNQNYINNVYGGNLCLDFGSKWGDNSLYPRSVQIIESGGLLLQSKQKNSKQIFGRFSSKYTYSNMAELISKIDTLSKHPSKGNFLIGHMFKRFKNDKYNDKTLKKIFKMSKLC